MGFQLADAFVELRTNKAPLTRELAEVREDVQRTHEKMMQLKEGGMRIFESARALVGLGALTLGLEQLIEKTNEEETSLMKLKAALTTAGRNVQEEMASFEKLNKALHDNLNVSKEQTRASEAMATSMGITADQTENLVKTAVGLAQVTQQDYSGTFQLLQRALEGNTMMLTRMLPQLKQAKTDTELWAGVQKIANQGLEQQKMMMGSGAEKMKTLQMSIDELEKSMGSALTPAIVASTEALTEFFKAFTEGEPEADRFEARMARFFIEEQLGFKKMQLDIQYMWSLLGGGSVDKKMYDEVAALQEQIDRLNDTIRKSGKEEDDVTAKRLMGLKKYKEATESTFLKVEDIWKDAQKRAIKNAEGMNGALMAGAGGGGGFGGGGVGGWNPGRQNGGGGGGAGVGAGAAPSPVQPATASSPSPHPAAAATAAANAPHDHAYWAARYAKKKEEYAQISGQDTDAEGNVAPRNRAVVDRLRRERDEAYDKSTYGSVARAETERWKHRDYAATQDRIKAYTRKRTSDGDDLQKEHDDVVGNKGLTDGVKKVLLGIIDPKLREERASEKRNIDQFTKGAMHAYERRTGNMEDKTGAAVDKEKAKDMKGVDSVKKGMQDAIQTLFGTTPKIELGSATMGVLNNISSQLPAVGGFAPTS